jgi:septum formation protein
MLIDKLKKYNIVLGSASPRRKDLLTELGIAFSIIPTQKEEKYPKNLKEKKVAEFLAKQKSDTIAKDLKKPYLLITADTIVTQNSEIIHKPEDKQYAIDILRKLSGNSHKVITGVCIKSVEKEVVFSSITEVFFTNLSDDEINFYIERYKPFDKAGSYGIQEWIGFIGIKKIVGSYNNVIGLPTAELYQKLKLFI